MRSLYKLICRILIATIAALSFTTANAGMIGVDQIAATSGAQADRAAVMTLLSRSEVSSQLQARGVDPQVARDRIAAMTDTEVQSLKSQIDAMPAGAGDWGWVVAVIVIAVVVWYFWFRR